MSTLTRYFHLFRSALRLVLLAQEQPLVEADSQPRRPRPQIRGVQRHHQRRRAPSEPDHVHHRPPPEKRDRRRRDRLGVARQHGGQEGQEQARQIREGKTIKDRKRGANLPS